MIGVIGRKIGMTQILDHVGDMVPVTVLRAGPVTVTQVLTKAKAGYGAVQVGFEPAEAKRLAQPQAKAFQKHGLEPKRFLREFRLPEAQNPEEFKVGQEIGAGLFEEGEFVDVQGQTIGKGFQGGTKRWGMKGGPETHGSMYHRRPGSSGSNTFPGRTWRGHKNPGQLGGDTQTIQNLLVMKVLKEDNAILVRGAVPGPRNSVVLIRKSFKRKKIDLTKLKAASKAGEKKDAGKKAPAKKPAPKK
jgi:large subunit ribosomal protein L3